MKINIGLTASCRGRRPRGEIGRKGASDRVRVRQLQAPVMGLRNPAGNGQAQSGAPSVVLRPGTGFVGAEKALENARLQVCRDTSSAIRYAQDICFPCATAGYRDAP